MNVLGVADDHRHGGCASLQGPGQSTAKEETAKEENAKPRPAPPRVGQAQKPIRLATCPKAAAIVSRQPLYVLLTRRRGYGQSTSSEPFATAALFRLGGRWDLQLRNESPAWARVMDATRSKQWPAGFESQLNAMSTALNQPGWGEGLPRSCAQLPLRLDFAPDGLDHQTNNDRAGQWRRSGSTCNEPQNQSGWKEAQGFKVRQPLHLQPAGNSESAFWPN